MKAQSQIFVYLFGVIVVGVIVLLGYSVIIRVTNDVQEIKDDRFKSELKNIVDIVSEEYGSLHIEKILLNREIETVCLGNSEISEISMPVASGQSNSDPIILDSISSEANVNVFLIDRKVVDSFYVPNMKVIDTFHCFENLNGLKIKVEGKGKYALVSPED